MSKRVLLVCGARPNFMKVAPIIKAMEASPLEAVLLHTGQHYDREMSKNFFDELGIPAPLNNLEVGAGTQAEQSAKIMMAFESQLKKLQPDLVLVVGDVNSTMSCAIVAKKAQLPVAHVEAGLRSGDRSMPEEINRMVTDAISDYFFITEEQARENLIREGRDPEKIFFSGNVMIDTLLTNLEKAKSFRSEKTSVCSGKEYVLWTMHRPANVDHKEVLSKLLDALDEIQHQIQIVFPLHPRTKKMLQNFNLMKRLQDMRHLHTLGPLSYFEMLNMLQGASFVVTDSGGVQEESTVLKVPCLTIRDHTERPVTVSVGSNEIVGRDPGKIVSAAERILGGEWKKCEIPKHWDGRAGERIVAELEKLL